MLPPQNIPTHASLERQSGGTGNEVLRIFRTMSFEPSTSIEKTEGYFLDFFRDDASKTSENGIFIVQPKTEGSRSQADLT